MSDPHPGDFSMFCATVAMNAKAGQLRDAHRAELLCMTLQCMRHDDEACGAVVRFSQLSRHDPAAAGAQLHDWLLGWLPEPEVASRPGEVLAEIAAEAEHGPFIWQARADLR